MLTRVRARAVADRKRAVHGHVAEREAHVKAPVHGVPAGESGTIVGAIGRHPIDRKKYAVVSDENGRHACTHWTLQERLGDYSLLRFKLDTGRTHQIRRHTAEAGFPIVGDRRYGGSSGRLWNRLALHATSLRFIHPVFKEPLHLHSQIPADLEGLFQPIQEAP